MKCKLLFVLVALLFVSANVHAVTVITVLDGSGADTYLTNDSQYGPDSTHGTETRIRACRQLADTRCRVGYIRFDITGLSEPDMTGSILTLDARNLKGSAQAVDVYGLIDGDGDSWDESTTTYNNAPGMAAATLGNYALDTEKVVLLGTITTPAAGDPYPVRFSSNSVDLPLAEFLAADTNGLVTLFFIGGNNEAELVSKERNDADWHAPTLTVMPEPATMMLLGLGSVLAMRRRK